MGLNNAGAEGQQTPPPQCPKKPSTTFVQEPVAIIGLSCRLPGNISGPRTLWNFLESGGIASTDVPASRFNVKGHHDGSKKPGTMRPPGGMFLEDVELDRFDAPFFEISRAEAVSMDPNQRQLLEVIYEGLENAGISLSSIDGTQVGCFIGSYASGKKSGDGGCPSLTGKTIMICRVEIL